MTAPAPRSSPATTAAAPAARTVRTPGRFRPGATCLALFLGGALAGPAAAGPNGAAKIQVHVHGLNRAVCASPTTRPPCDGILTAGNLYPALYYVQLLVTDGDREAGVSALECGIDYQDPLLLGVDIFGFTLCADLLYPTAGANGPWPSARSHARIEWTDPDCQQYEPGTPGSGVVADVGYFYLSAYSADDLRIIPAPVSGAARVASCAAVIDTVEGGGVVRVPSHLGSARFSAGATEPGYSPCGLATPVRPTTWGRIKATYRGVWATEMREQ